MMLDIESAQPTLLTHGERDEIADFDQLRFAEIFAQSPPEFVIDGQIPGDRLSVRQRRFLSLVVARRALEVDQITIVIFHDALARRLHGTLIAAILALYRARDVNAAKFLNAVIGNTVLEDVPPAVGE